ncbi:hypothetical protein GW17_00062065 [Ensete ventricosum]|nr:hypothetical protein GW17_00062065 [Ensete ventricosum]
MTVTAPPSTPSPVARFRFRLGRIGMKSELNLVLEITRFSGLIRPELYGGNHCGVDTCHDIMRRGGNSGSIHRQPRDSVILLIRQRLMATAVREGSRRFERRASRNGPLPPPPPSYKWTPPPSFFFTAHEGVEPACDIKSESKERRRTK